MSAVVARVTRPRLQPALAVILLAALLLRVAAIVTTGPATLRFGDAQDYVDAAASLCEQGRYPDRGSLPFFRAPGLPFFLAAATLCHPRNVVAAKIALATCDVGTAGLACTLVLLLFGDGARRAALLAAALVAVDPFLVLASSDVKSEPLATLLLTASLCALLRARHAAASSGRAGIAFACLGGVALALASLTRPASLAVAPAWLLIPLPPRTEATDDARPSHAATVVLASALALAASLAPWTLRNLWHFGEPIVVNDAGGYNAWRGTHPRLHEMLSSTTPARFADDSRALEQDLDRLAREDGLGVGASPGERDRGWWAAARANLAADGAGAARVLARNVVPFFRPSLDPRAHGPVAVAVSLTWFLVLGALALRGTASLWRRDRALVVLFVAGVLLAGLAHLPFQTVLRFRLPFTEPLLLALAAAGASQRPWPWGSTR